MSIEATHKSRIKTRWLWRIAQLSVALASLAATGSMFVIVVVLMTQNGTRVAVTDGTMQSCYLGTRAN